MLGSTLSFQASGPLTCPRLLFPVTPVVTTGLLPSPACPLLLARLCLCSWTPGSHLTSLEQLVVGGKVSEPWRADLGAESFPGLPAVTLNPEE